VHWAGGSPNSGWLPCSFAAPCRWPSRAAPGPLDHSRANIDTFLMGCIGIGDTPGLQQLMPGASCAQLRRSGKSPRSHSSNCIVRPLPTLLVGALGGLLVGVTSVGSGSLIMITLLLLYPALPAAQLVGTDLMQAVPLGFRQRYPTSSSTGSGLENCGSAHPRLGSRLHVRAKTRPDARFLIRRGHRCWFSSCPV